MIPPAAKTEAFEADLFPAAWQPLLTTLAAQPDTTIEPGADVTVSGRVAGSYVAEIIRNGRTLLVVDATSEGATAVADSLRGSGRPAVTVDPAAPAAEAQINTALGTL